MAVVAPAMNAGYAVNNVEERENGGGFEFTRRKRWPHLLLQELVGSALFCLKPVPQNQGSSHSSISGFGWKMVYVSPAVGEMLSQKPNELEGKDFFDLVFAPDQPQLQNLLTSLVLPTPPPLAHQPSSNITTTSSNSVTPPHQSSSSGKSYTTYVRMMADSPVVWELRAHATGLDSAGTGAVGVGGAPVGFGYAGNGALIPQPQGEAGDAMKGKAIWVMGRRAVENTGEEANGQSLDAFLELKLENERLREELRRVQQDLEDEDIPIPRPLDPAPVYPNPNVASPGPSSPTPSSSSSSNSSPALKNKPVKKRQKKVSVSNPAAGNKGAEGEGLHVCVTCGRTDSPEWRKGPLGPKTLCNACGLRWAKRNSTAPSRKEKKAMADGKA